MGDSEVNYYPPAPIPYPLFFCLSPFYFCLLFGVLFNRLPEMTIAGGVEEAYERQRRVEGG